MNLGLHDIYYIRTKGSIYRGSENMLICMQRALLIAYTKIASKALDDLDSI